LRLVRELRREIHSLGVTGGQVSLLVAIKYQPGIGVRELAAQERMSPAAVSKAVTKLEQMGLVERSAVEDRRRVGLTVSDTGHQVLRSVRSRRTIWLAERLKELSPEELARVEAAIEPLEKLVP
jgi:DNA-binding MarR family transcriptional regulator